MVDEIVRKIDRRFVVLEDDNQKVCLFVFSGAVITYGHDYTQGGDVIEDLKALANGTEPEGNNDENYAEMMNIMTARKGHWEIIADNNGFYPKKMKAAGLKAFGILAD